MPPISPLFSLFIPASLFLSICFPVSITLVHNNVFHFPLSLPLSPLPHCHPPFLLFLHVNLSLSLHSVPHTLSLSSFFLFSHSATSSLASLSPPFPSLFHFFPSAIPLSPSLTLSILVMNILEATSPTHTHTHIHMSHPRRGESGEIKMVQKITERKRQKKEMKYYKWKRWKDEEREREGEKERLYKDSAGIAKVAKGGMRLTW